RDQVVVAEQRGRFVQIANLAIIELDVVRGQGRQRQEREARERSDHFAALDESREVDSDAVQLRVLYSHAAHGDQADLHRRRTPTITSAAPASRLATGTPKPQ